MFFPNAMKAQRDPVVVFAKEYYRSDPFKTSFNTFVNHLTGDPDLQPKVIHRKTDTSLFQVSGFYKTWKPIRTPGLSFQVILEERAVQVQQGIEADTILMYHLIIYADDSTSKGQSLIQKEYDRITRKWKKRFYSNTSAPVSREGREVGHITNFFVYYADMAPISVAWMKVDGKPQTVLNLTMRLVNRDGLSSVPMAYYEEAQSEKWTLPPPRPFMED